MPIYILSDRIAFPPAHFAREDGLLAMGGDLSEERLLFAYKQGIFPWFSPGDPILWWSPDPRLVLYPKEFKIPKSLKRTINKNLFQVTMDTAFEQVISACAQVRIQKDEPTWIVDGMIEAYCNLHESGFAHSVEAWHNGELAGGVYGVSLGKCFFGESMFTRITNASKIAFVALMDYLKSLSFDIVDCQITTEHLIRFGAREIPRDLFLRQLTQSLDAETHQGKWHYVHP